MISNINVQYLENHNIICVATDYNDGDEAINYRKSYILNDGRWKKFCDDIEDQYEIDYNNLKIYSINDYLLSNVYGIDNNGNTFSCIKIFKLDIISRKWLKFKNTIFTNKSTNLFFYKFNKIIFCNENNNFFEIISYKLSDKLNIQFNDDNINFHDKIICKEEINLTSKNSKLLIKKNINLISSTFIYQMNIVLDKYMFY